jgi:hypothetical protein
MTPPFLFPETARFLPVPLGLEHLVAPAKIGLFEWTDYHFVFPGAQKLKVDGAQIQKLAPHIWRVRWENRVGNARLIPLSEDDKASESALEVEVLSPKFPTFELHIHFFAALWRELSVRFAPLLWQHSGQGTRRGASVERGQPSPGEALDWLELNGDALEALARNLDRRPTLHQTREEWDAPLTQVRRVESGQLGRLAQSSTWARSGARPLPSHVAQTRWNEGESPLRLRLGAFIFRVLLALDEGDETARLWKRRLAFWSKPNAQSVALVARDALSVELAHLEASWGVSATPVWGRIQRAARLRDIATLWEWWVLLALARELEIATGERAQWSEAFDERAGLRAPATVGFGALSLLFNGATPSYSTPLRPDFVLRENGEPVAALDAKFRLNVERGGVVGDDLHKMHAYRDALGVRVALALHPGQKSVFYERERGPLTHWNLRAVLNGSLSGVGAWGLRP